MSIQFIADGSNTVIPVSTGGVDVGSGAYTIVALMQADSDNAGVFSAFAGGTLSRYLFVNDAFLGALDDYQGVGGGYQAAALTHDTWYVVAQSKAAGSNKYRFHLWAYASDGSGTMSHGDSALAGNHGDAGPITQYYIGEPDDHANGLTALIGVWNTALTDAQLNTLVSTSAASWAALSPGALLSAEHFDGTGPSVVDLVGTMVASAITGTSTTIAGANPPSFNFSIAAGGTNFTKAPADSVGIHDTATAVLQTPSGTGLIGAVADNLMNTQLLNTYRWIEMRIGPPGANGTANVAANTVRKQVTWGTAINGVAVSTTDVVWTGVPASEQYTNFAAYAASSGGTPAFTGTVSGDAASSGFNWTLSAGQLQATLPIAAT